jgi:uncharacterized protein YndB with AHSA1/START domain
MAHTIRYEIGTHVLELSATSSRWRATVDGTSLDRWFMSSADAWTAGVTEALRMEENKVCLFAGRDEPGRTA